MKFDRIVFHIDMHRLTESANWYDVLLNKLTDWFIDLLTSFFEYGVHDVFSPLATAYKQRLSAAR